MTWLWLTKNQKQGLIINSSFNTIPQNASVKFALLPFIKNLMSLNKK
jgi:hypothetical protein